MKVDAEMSVIYADFSKIVHIFVDGETEGELANRTI